MSLSCLCALDDEAVWYWYAPSEPVPFSELSYKRRKRCDSCGELIGWDEECILFDRTRYPKNEIEARIHGDSYDAVSLVPLIHCESCAELYMTLYEIGYTCIQPNEPVRDALQEYWELTGFDPSKCREEA